MSQTSSPKVAHGSPPEPDPSSLDLPRPDDDPRAAALRYVDLGFAVVQLCQPNGQGECTCPPNKHDPKRAGKVPRRKGWEKLGTTEDEVRSWWKGRGWDRSNVGLVMGGPRRLVALDVDGPAGRASLTDLEEAHGDLPPTLTARTGGGGEHRVFTVPEDLDMDAIPNRASHPTMGPGLDVRGPQGQIVVAPSIHPSGQTYEWTDPREPAPLPRWLYERMVASARAPQEQPRRASHEGGGSDRDRVRSYCDAALRRAAAAVRSAPEGTRNSTLNSEALAVLRLAAGGHLDVGLVRETLRAAALAVGLEQIEVDRTLDSAWRKAQAQPRDPPKPQPRPQQSKPDAATQPSTGFHCTDTGNAERLVAKHGQNLRWSALGWLSWDGTRWVRDERHRVQALAKEVVRGIYSEAASSDDEPRRQALARHAAKSEGRAARDNMVALAQSEPGIPVTVDELDADPWLLNVQNGTVYLRTGELLPHRRENLCTKLAPVEYDPNATAPTWDEFLKRCLPDENVRTFVQRYVGYSLTGGVGEQCLAFFYGKGANGKSTFLVVLLAILGQYAMKAAPDLLLSRKHDAHPTELADLLGVRIAICNEVEQNRWFAEARLKELTGGEPIKARKMREDFFTIPPTWKLIVAGNHKPRTRGTDFAFWRRLHLVPWTVTIPKGDQDPDLGAKLLGEAPGILAWLVRGCLAWQSKGLLPPEAVQAATQEYRDENDTVAQFVSDECVESATASCTVADLYARYLDWSGPGAHTLSKADLRTRLMERPGAPFTRRGAHGTITWSGIGLLTRDDPPEPPGDDPPY